VPSAEQQPRVADAQAETKERGALDVCSDMEESYWKIDLPEVSKVISKSWLQLFHCFLAGLTLPLENM